MHSRSILIAGVFALVCLLVAGSLALHLTAAHAGGQGVSASTAAEPRERTDGPLRAAPAPARGGVADRQMPFETRLQFLLESVHVSFERTDAGVNDVMIPYLADMITLINQHDEFVYRIEITDPDAALARRRAQTLNDVLRMNVVRPSGLHIAGSPGPPAARLHVSAE